MSGATYYGKKFDELKVGANVSAFKTAGGDTLHVLNTETPAVIKYRQSFDGSNIFSGVQDIL